MVRIKSKIPKTPSEESVSVLELIGLIPEEFIEELSTEIQIDKYVNKLKGKPFFQLILFSILQGERLSLRVIEGNYTDPLFRILAPALVSDSITWVGIRERLMKMNSDFFRRLYEKVYEMAEKKHGAKHLAKHHLKRFDSTMVHTFTHLLSGMKVGNTSLNKTQVKFTTELKDNFLIQMTFHKDQAHLSEETALKEAVLKQSQKKDAEISVFDKGLKGRKTFAKFDAENILFVGRLNESPNYDFLATHSNGGMVEEEQNNAKQKKEDLIFIQDSVVNLYESNKKANPTKFRMIQYKVAKTGVMLSFVTNVWDMDASVIAQIYKRRWDIEVLFRFMKQEMNLTHFVSNDENAIQAMLYCTLIASMLVLIFKQKNNIKSYKIAKIQFFKELLYNIVLDKLDDPEATKHLKQVITRYTKRE